METTILTIIAYISMLIGHEALHYIVARAYGFRGLRLRVEPYRGIIGFTFTSAPLKGLAAALLAPQAITIAALAAYLATGSIVALAVLASNIAGSIPDYINAFDALRLSSRYRVVIVTENGLTFA